MEESRRGGGWLGAWERELCSQMCSAHAVFVHIVHSKLNAAHNMLTSGKVFNSLCDVHQISFVIAHCFNTVSAGKGPHFSFHWKASLFPIGPIPQQKTVGVFLISFILSIRLCQCKFSGEEFSLLSLSTLMKLQISIFSTAVGLLLHVALEITSKWQSSGSKILCYLWQQHF